MDYKQQYEQFEARVNVAINASDLDALLNLDQEVLALLESLSGNSRSEREDVLYKVFLEKLGRLYQQMQSYLVERRAEASDQLQSISESKKGIKAYQSHQ